MNRQSIIKSISTSFPTEWHNATRFGVKQILMAITLSTICGISRICKISPVFQYASNISTYKHDAAGLHEICKQRSTSETWIEQVKSHAMAGATLYADFWAIEILWQLSVYAYNISAMMRHKKNKFKRQEHRTFIDWFIAVPAKITRSGHQTEIKMYENHFHKAAWEDLDRPACPACRQAGGRQAHRSSIRIKDRKEI